MNVEIEMSGAPNLNAGLANRQSRSPRVNDALSSVPDEVTTATVYQFPPLPPIDQTRSVEGQPSQSMVSESAHLPQSSSQRITRPPSYVSATSSHNDGPLAASSLPVTKHAYSTSYSEASNHPQASYLGESGYMPFLNHEQHTSSKTGGGPVTIEIRQTVNPLSPALRKSYTEIFIKHCFTFCPVLDPSLLALPEFENSLALQQSIGLIGSVIQPSLLHGDTPAAYYENARLLIQGGYEPNPLAALMAVMLFYWFAAAPPTVISMNGVWWWIGVAVRQAQELGLHRECNAGQTFRPGESIGLRHRIWWTLFARERLTAICQGRPCIINPRDCDVREPSPTDFPDPDDPRAMVFVQWVRLCAIVGRVGDHLRRNPNGAQVAHERLEELRKWAQNLPESLRLPFTRATSTELDADLYQLHLPYLSCIALLHMKKSSQALPKAYTPALLAASCTARIFEEILVRGSLRFLQGMAGWHIAIALMALLHVRQVGRLQEAADEHIRVLRVALRELARRFDSAKMYDRSIENLLNAQQRHNALLDPQEERPQHFSDESPVVMNQEVDPVLQDEQQDWLKYFPGLPTNLSPLLEILLVNNQPTLFSDFGSGNDLSYLLYDIFDNPLDGINGGPSDHLAGWGMSMTNGSFI
ncbi:hypothetical protein AYO21_06484 [Fonsecaea monophora]|uniref:Xylanolytic transcriptional activator regulatory domain-containing protein n=1 Tax=Fonsecaea monophora TaxID=254056 RepID=A0A177F6Q7_9EURO|nr:hypothetical protein AYO21_06484 [Fonsecaea monophora]OAG39280.1 hypothetical protein AYO21_06484 [Fonsecaea monophora]